MVVIIHLFRGEIHESVAADTLLTLAVAEWIRHSDSTLEDPKFESDIEEVNAQEEPCVAVDAMGRSPTLYISYQVYQKYQDLMRPILFSPA